MTNQTNQPGALEWALTRLAQLGVTALDTLQLERALSEASHGDASEQGLDGRGLRKLVLDAGWTGIEVLLAPDVARLPLLARIGHRDWGVLVSRGADGCWHFQNAQGIRMLANAPEFTALARLTTAEDTAGAQTDPQDFRQKLRSSLSLYRGRIWEAIAASFFINLLNALIAFFSMLVYDRVIPSRSVETLIVLFGGVIILILADWALKAARARVMETAVGGLDSKLSREVFERLLRVRLDQLPSSVGSLAGQLRSYEQVRNFYTAATLFALVDLPAALIFIGVVVSVANPWIAGIPLTMALAAIVAGMLYRKRVGRQALNSVQAANVKTGLLVETVEGAETIKAASGGWRFLSRWISLNADSLRNELALRHTNETVMHFMVAAQQLSYASIVGVGAWFVVQGDVTMGAVIASSILGGRVLSAVMHLPNLMIQHAHAQAAIKSMEVLFHLKLDNHGVARPLVPSRIDGNYDVQGVTFAYADCPPALQLPRLQISAGERVAVLGPIGSGKSTLLKVMAGLYAPEQGRVLVDNMDIAQIAKEALSRNVTYVQQDQRMFAGTLRENLLLGLPDPGDDALQEAMRLSGLDRLTAAHPRGLELPIFEGGRGLSGGQRQLLAFTRLLLCKPRVMLLDEPTASMDEALERRCIELLRSAPYANATMVLVTHKPALLALVSRIVLVVRGNIVMDGPKDEILARLMQQNAIEGPKSPAPRQAPAPSRPVQPAPAPIAEPALSARPVS